VVEKIASSFLTLAYMTLITIISLSNFDNAPKFSFVHMDKLIHCIIYFIFYFLVFNTTKVYKLKKSLIISIIFSVGFGILIEICQPIFTLYRQFDVLDILANTAGVFLMVILINSRNSLIKY